MSELDTDTNFKYFHCIHFGRFNLYEFKDIKWNTIYGSFVFVFKETNGRTKDVYASVSELESQFRAADDQDIRWYQNNYELETKRMLQK